MNCCEQCLGHSRLEVIFFNDGLIWMSINEFTYSASRLLTCYVRLYSVHLLPIYLIAGILYYDLHHLYKLSHNKLQHNKEENTRRFVHGLNCVHNTLCVFARACT